MKLWSSATCAAITLALATATSSTAGQTSGTPQRFTAFAVNMGTFGPVQSGMVEMVVTRWSTADEREKLIRALMDKGPEGLLAELTATRAVGYIRTPNSLRYDLHYARTVPGEDGGHRVVLATDRPIGFWEAANQPRSIEYPYTVIELRLNPDGDGEGKMSIATRITGDKESGLIELEDYALQPVRLMNVHSAKLPTS